jgi:hypothetical protein
MGCHFGPEENKMLAAVDLLSALLFPVCSEQQGRKMLGSQLLPVQSRAIESLKEPWKEKGKV